MGENYVTQPEQKMFYESILNYFPGIPQKENSPKIANDEKDETL